MALQGEVIVDVGVDRSELLLGLHLPKPEHGPLSSAKRQVAVLTAVVRPSARFLLGSIAWFIHRGAI
jgi:hypothetical protein